MGSALAFGAEAVPAGASVAAQSAHFILIDVTTIPASAALANNYFSLNIGVLHLLISKTLYLPLINFVTALLL